MKLSMQQVEDSYETVNENDWMYDFEGLDELTPRDLQPMDKEISSDVYRTSVSRKELRSKAVKEREGIIGHGKFKRRKF